MVFILEEGVPHRDKKASCFHSAGLLDTSVTSHLVSNDTLGDVKDYIFVRQLCDKELKEAKDKSFVALTLSPPHELPLLLQLRLHIFLIIGLLDHKCVNLHGFHLMVLAHTHPLKVYLIKPLAESQSLVSVQTLIV